MTKTTRKPLAYSFSFDADRLDGKQWIVTEEFISGWSVIAEFATKTEAQDCMLSLSMGISNRGHR